MLVQHIKVNLGFSSDPILVSMCYRHCFLTDLNVSRRFLGLLWAFNEAHVLKQLATESSRNVEVYQKTTTSKL